MSKVDTNIERRVGSHFEVEMYPDRVVKTPRGRGLTDGVLRVISYRQQQLAHIEGVPKIEHRDGKLIEERAPGVPIHELELGEDELDWIDERLQTILEAIENEGWVRRDVHEKNVLYDRSTKRVTLIDYVDMHRVGEAGYRRRYMPRILKQRKRRR
jgi:hypothetical protein